MSDTKTCVVFGVTKEICQGRRRFYGGVDFYVFDEDFNPVSFDGDVIPEYKKKNNEQAGEEEKDVDDDDDDDELPSYWPSHWPIMKDPSQISLPISCRDHWHAFQSYATLQGRVYCAGGSIMWCKICHCQVDYVSKLVDCWDTVKSPCWTRLPDMKVGRENLKLHVLQGKLYAIGGTGYNCQPIFIEMLDVSISGCEWTSLSAPPFADYHHFVSAAFEDKGFILFGSAPFEYFYAYRPPPHDTWTPMLNLPFNSTQLPCIPLHSQTVSQNHLLWLTDDRGSTLGGFDINDGSYFKIDLAYEGLLPSDEFLHCDCSPQVVHVGDGVVAVVWNDIGHYHLKGQGKGQCDENCYLHGDFRDSYMRFHCCRFSIDFVKAKKKCCKFWSDTEKRCLIFQCPRRKKCCKLLSHKTCVGAEIGQKLDAAFFVDVAMPVGDPSNTGSCSVLPQKRGRDRVAFDFQRGVKRIAR